MLKPRGSRVQESNDPRTVPYGAKEKMLAVHA